MSILPIRQNALHVPETPATLSGTFATRRELALTEKEAARIGGRTARALANIEADALIGEAEDWALHRRTLGQLDHTGREYDLATSIARENPAAASALHAILSSATSVRVDRNLRTR